MPRLPRLFRYLLIWLSCTATSVTAVMATVHFVVGSTRPTPPVAQSAPQVAASPSPSPSRSPSGDPTPSEKPEPSPSRTTRSPAPAPSPTPEPTRTPEPEPEPEPETTAPTTPKTVSGAEGNCDRSDSGVHTVPSTGGKASVRYGEGTVCLVSAVPNRGFTVSTEQTAADTLTVTFSGDRHRSEITATAVPSYRASVRETSW